MPYTLIRLSHTHLKRYRRFISHHFHWVPSYLRQVLTAIFLWLRPWWHSLRPYTRRFDPFGRQAVHLLHIKWRVLKWKWRFLKRFLGWKWKFLQWKWHMLQRFWGLPRWIKLLKLAVLLIILAGYYGWSYLAQEREIAAIYNEYYPHYYKAYREKNISDARAHYYASYYARYYAEYYASDEYKEALKYALPPPTQQALSYPKNSKNADLTLTPEKPIPASKPILVEPRLEITAAQPEMAPAPLSTPAPEHSAAMAIRDKSTDTQTDTQIASLPVLPENVPPPKPVPLAATNLSGLALIKHFEGFSATPYADSGGRLTIGYGHLLRRGEVWQQISEVEAEGLLVQDIRLAEAVVKRNVQVELTPNQFAALVSLVYNIGEGHFEKSTLLKRLNRGEHETASREFLRWKYVGKQEVRGLYRRRLRERELFLAA